MYGALRRVFKKRFVGLHFGQVFHGQLNPYYVLKLGIHSYYYFIMFDLLNEMLLSISTTSTKMLGKLKESLTSEKLSIAVGKYALTYQDRVLTCGSLKLLNSKSPDFGKAKDIIKHAVIFIENIVEKPLLFSQLAVFSLYKTNRGLENRNSSIIVSPEGHICQAGLLIGSVSLNINVKTPKTVTDVAPYVELYPCVNANVKVLVCRPDPQDLNMPIKCWSRVFKALVNKSLVSLLTSKDQNIGLVFVNWCPDLSEKGPILTGYRPLSSEELANFVFGKTLLLSSFENINRDAVYRICIPEARLRRIYENLTRELKYRLGAVLNTPVDALIKEHERYSRLLRVQGKNLLFPITLKYYLRHYKLLSSSLSTILLKRVEGEVVYLNRKHKSSDKSLLVEYMNRVLAIRPLISEHVQMII